MNIIPGKKQLALRYQKTYIERNLPLFAWRDCPYGLAAAGTETEQSSSRDIIHRGLGLHLGSSKDRRHRAA